MTANQSIDPAQFLSDRLEHAEPDLLRSMLMTFIDALMGAEADALCGAPYGAPTQERVNSRNGYRARDWDTRAGTMEVAIPKLRMPRLRVPGTDLAGWSRRSARPSRACHWDEVPGRGCTLRQAGTGDGARAGDG